MPRYKANVRFGPWRIGEEFESIDNYHAKLAAEGILTELHDSAQESQEAPYVEEEPQSLLGVVYPETSEDADVPSDEEPTSEES